MLLTPLLSILPSQFKSPHFAHVLLYDTKQLCPVILYFVDLLCLYITSLLNHQTIKVFFLALGFELGSLVLGHCFVHINHLPLILIIQFYLNLINNIVGGGPTCLS